MKVRAMLVKLPPFAISNLELWFSQTVWHFAITNIKDDTTKFNHIYFCLLEKISYSFFLNPPTTGKVVVLKTIIMNKYDRMQQQKDIELLQIRPLGDLKPSKMFLQALSLVINPRVT